MYPSATFSVSFFLLKRGKKILLKCIWIGRYCNSNVTSNTLCHYLSLSFNKCIVTRNKCKIKYWKMSRDSVYVKHSYEIIGCVLFYSTYWGKKVTRKRLIWNNRDWALKQWENIPELCRVAFIPWRKSPIIETVLKSIEHANIAPRAIFCWSVPVIWGKKSSLCTDNNS